MVDLRKQSSYTANSVRLDFYGVICDIIDRTHENGREILDGICHDFYYFIASGNQAPSVEIILTNSREIFPGRRVEWPDGTVVFDRIEGHLRQAHIRCTQESVDYVINYIQSVTGEILEKLGWFRMHACGFSRDGQLEIWSAYSGAGKSSRTLSVLNFTDEKILGDEMLYFYRGKVYPYPVPIATCLDAVNSTRDRSFLNSRKHLTAVPRNRVSESSSEFVVRCVGRPDRLRFIFEFVLGLGLPQMYVYLVRPRNLPWLCFQAFARLRFALSLWNRLKPAELSELRREMQNSSMKESSL